MSKSNSTIEANFSTTLVNHLPFHE